MEKLGGMKDDNIGMFANAAAFGPSGMVEASGGFLFRENGSLAREMGSPPVSLCDRSAQSPCEAYLATTTRQQDGLLKQSHAL